MIGLAFYILIIAHLSLGLIALIDDWISGWERALGNRDQVEAFMERCRKNNNRPRIAVVISVISTYLVLGCLAFGLKKFEW